MEDNSTADLEAIDALAERAYDLRFLDAAAALELSGSALARAERAEYPRGMIRALVALAAARCRRMELDQAAAALERALEILETHPDPVGRARALSWQGSIAFRREDFNRCTRLLGEALTRHREVGDRAGEAEVLVKIGGMQMVMGDLVAALDSFAQGRSIREELGDLSGIAMAANDIAGALAELGELESARQAFEEVLDFYRKGGTVSLEAIALANLGLCCFELGEYEPSLAYLEEALRLGRQTGEAALEARALCSLGRVHHAQGDPQQALSYFSAAEEAGRSSGEHFSEIMSRAGAARVRVQLGTANCAVDELTALLPTAENMGLQRLVADVHEALAEAHEAAGNPEGALRHYKAFHAVREKVQKAGAALRTRHREELGHLRRVQQETELQVLKAQLHPHFLLNALHAVATLIEPSPAEATRALNQLSDLLRLALAQSAEQYATLQAELEFSAAYVKLEQVRYPNAFTLETYLEPGLETVPVPHLLVQPLAENAIRHGLSRADGAGKIEIRAERAHSQRLWLIVRDNGAGLPAGWSMDAPGVGLRNTRLRLQRLYGAEYELRVEPLLTGGTQVEMVLPISPPGRMAGSS